MYHLTVCGAVECHAHTAWPSCSGMSHSHGMAITLDIPFSPPSSQALICFGVVFRTGWLRRSRFAHAVLLCVQIPILLQVAHTATRRFFQCPPAPLSSQSHQI